MNIFGERKEAFRLLIYVALFLVGFFTTLLWANVAYPADLTVTWDPPTTYVDGTPIDKPVRYWVKENGNAVDTVTGTTYAALGRGPGSYCYQIIAVVSADDGTDKASDPSPVECANVDQPRPNAPTGVTITVNVPSG